VNALKHVAVLTLTALVLTGCGGPPLKVYERDDQYYIDVRQLGEYVSTVNRLQLLEGKRVVWEIRATGETAQFGYLSIQPGDNPAQFSDAYYGGYRTIVPSTNTFRLEPDHEYVVLAWSGRGWPSKASFRVKTAKLESSHAS